MKRWIVYTIVLLTIALLGVGGAKVIAQKRALEAEAKPPKSYEVVVRTLLPQKSKSQLTLPFLAISKSSDSVKISSKISSRINAIIKSGVHVSKGDVIIRLDDEDLKNKLQALDLNIESLSSSLKAKQIALQNLETTHQRTQNLLTIQGASKEQFDREVTNIEALKSGIESLEYKIKELNANKNSIYNTLSYTTIKAPIDGTVTSLSNTGDMAMPGKPLVSISSDSNSYLLVRLPATIKATGLRYKGKRLKLLSLNTTFNGLLEYLANIDESLAAEQKIEVSVIVYDGMGYQVPVDTILNREGKSYVLEIVEHRAIPKEVRIVAEGEEGIVIEGIDGTERIAVAKPDILLKLLSGVGVKGL